MPSDLQLALDSIRDRIAFVDKHYPDGQYRNGFIDALENAAAIIRGLQILRERTPEDVLADGRNRNKQEPIP